MENERREDEGIVSKRRRLGDSLRSGKQQKGIRWERFLPTRSLRVLLVEHDDSTRHIIAALLRKCCYQVAAFADGLKAWEVMKQKNYSLDLVLTEVEMPSLSGLCLLDKIVGTEECKNIPVIMMSSEDSVNIVLKCMLKGAADFLVKPVRKNELRNLWQHVWRRQRVCSFSYSSFWLSTLRKIDSVAGNQSQTGENSDEYSDVQNLRSKPDLRIEISQKHGESILAMQDCFQAADEEDTEQPVKNVNLVADSLMEVDLCTFRDESSVAGNAAVISIPKAYAVQNSSQISYGEVNLGSVKSAKYESAKPSLLNETNAPKESLQSVVGSMQSFSNAPCSYPPMEMISVKENESSVDIKFSRMNPVLDFSASTTWELFSRGTHGCVQHWVQERDILNHSNTSAFSRYGGKTTKSAFQKLNSSSACIKDRKNVDQSHLHVIVDHENQYPDVSSVAYNNDDEIKMKILSDGNEKDLGTLPSDTQNQETLGGQENTFLHGPCHFLPNLIPVEALPCPSFYAGFGASIQPSVCTPFQQNSAVVEHTTVKCNCDHHGHHGDHCTGHSRSNVFYCHNPSYQLPDGERDAEAGDQRELTCSWKEQFKNSGSKGNDEARNTSAAIRAALEIGNENGVQNSSSKGTYYDSANREAALVKFG
ncbi:hypothetical protein HPP92_008808 [Vanilla planifolia]|uniref:Response regulatory domain-containing protein n=1 Tax=Vanilla planifolia TaxID=51239 RepID=A0A835V2H3_VANPL|nr:hypothetical protein HPP92_009038 [Vanilla planifolia]KAG0486713.1 hypothetical protein HPP92_008808 [Vanilla planifolia]